MNNNHRIFIGTATAWAVLTAPLFLLEVNGVLLTAWLTSLLASGAFACALYWAANRDSGMFVTTAALPLLAMRYAMSAIGVNIAAVLLMSTGIWSIRVGWLIFVHLILAAFFIWKTLAVDTGRGEIEKVENSVKVSTSRWYTLRNEISTLQMRFPGDKNIAAVADAIRYADPVSNDALAEIEATIAGNIRQLAAAQPQETEKTCCELLLQIKQRNILCRSLKHQ